VNACDPAAVVTLATLSDAFFTARIPRMLSPHTLKAYRSDLARLPIPSSTPVEALTTATMRQAFAEVAPGLAPASVSRLWSVWNQLLDFAVAEGHLPGNPMAAVAKPKLGRTNPKAIQGDESIARLLVAARAGRLNARDPWPERDYAVVVILVVCGLRASELLALTVGSVDGPEGDRVIAVRGKGNKERTVPIKPEADRIIAAYLTSRAARFRPAKPSDPLILTHKGEAMRRGGLSHLIAGLYDQAGIRAQVPKGALVHALRHTFATSVARGGATGTELQRLLGHESLATTQRYVDATGREVREAAGRNGAYVALQELEAS